MTRDDIIRMALQCQLVTTGNRDGIYMDALERFAQLVAAAEREACAKVADKWVRAYQHPSQSIADEIRARGEATSRGQQ